MIKTLIYDIYIYIYSNNLKLKQYIDKLSKLNNTIIIYKRKY